MSAHERAKRPQLMDNDARIDPAQPAERLDSWKAIARYLQRDVATVRRWEKSSGLPVRRVPGGSSRAVFAYASELEAWLNAGGSTSPAGFDGSTPADNGAPNGASASPRTARTVWGRIGLAAIVVAALAIAGAWRLRAVHVRPDDLRIDVTPDAVVARDGGGTELWRRVFPPDFVTAFSGYGKRSEVVGGANPAVFMATGNRIRRSDNFVESGELTEMTVSGEVKRRFSFGDHVTFDRKEYGPPGGMTTFAIDDRGAGRPFVVVRGDGNPARSPRRNVDIAVQKSQRVKGTTMSVRAEIINFFNFADLLGPNVSFGSPTFGQIPGVGGFPRLLQLSVRAAW